MADLLYEMEFEVKTSSIDKAEHRLKRFDAAMERSSGVAKELQRTISTIGTGGGRIGGSGGVVRSSSAGSGPVMGIDAETRRVFAFQRRMQTQRTREERESLRLTQQKAREEIRAGKEQDRQQRAIFRFQDRMERQRRREEKDYLRQQERERTRLYSVERSRSALSFNRMQQRDASSASGMGWVDGTGLGMAATGLAAVSAGVMAALQKINQFGTEALAAGSQRTSSLRTYTTLLGGDRGRAELEYYRGQRFAQQTDFTNAQVEEKQNMLLTQGFRGDDLYRSLFASADAAAAQPEAKRQEAFDAMTRAFVKVRQKRALTLDEVNEEFATGGGSGEILRSLVGKHFGVTKGTEIDKLFSSKRVTDDIGIPLMQQALLQQLGTKRLGEFSTQSAGGITSLLSNISEGRENLAKSFDLETLPATERYRAALTDLSRMFDVNTEAGKNMAFVYQDLADKAIGAKSAVATAETSFYEAFSKSYRAERERSMKLDPFADAAAIHSQDSMQKAGEMFGGLGTQAARAAAAGDKVLGFLADMTLAARQLASPADTFRKFYEVADGGKIHGGLLNKYGEKLQSDMYNDNTQIDRDSRFSTRVGSFTNIPTYTARQKLKQVQAEEAKSRRSRGTNGNSSGGDHDGTGGDDHSVRIGTQVTVQQMTVQVTVPAQPGITPQAMSTMIGESVREALVREVGRGARRPRV